MPCAYESLTNPAPAATAPAIASHFGKLLLSGGGGDEDEDEVEPDLRFDVC